MRHPSLYFSTFMDFCFKNHTFYTSMMQKLKMKFQLDNYHLETMNRTQPSISSVAGLLVGWGVYKKADHSAQLTITVYIHDQTIHISISKNRWTY